jgi:BirA family biotin operon repressor/biotin-[acetyl-CoA-carboxylase] ligase
LPEILQLAQKLGSEEMRRPVEIEFACNLHSQQQTANGPRNATLSQREQPTAIWADYQTAGRGCGTNTWESERGKNLLFSLLLHPENLPANEQFQISMAISLAIVDALGQLVGDLSIKWPNDIYWRNGKLAGILIENTLKGSFVKDSVVGVGLNVNQREFRSKAPNPVSLWQITGQETDREQLLRAILQAFDNLIDTRESAPSVPIKVHYMKMLYRRKGFHPYTDKDGAFMAEIAGIEDDGHLLLTDDNGQQRRYAFKEVQFVI